MERLRIQALPYVHEDDNLTDGMGNTNLNGDGFAPMVIVVKRPNARMSVPGAQTLGVGKAEQVADFLVDAVLLIASREHDRDGGPVGLAHDWFCARPEQHQ